MSRDDNSSLCGKRLKQDESQNSTKTVYRLPRSSQVMTKENMEVEKESSPTSEKPQNDPNHIPSQDVHPRIKCSQASALAIKLAFETFIQGPILQMWGPRDNLGPTFSVPRQHRQLADKYTNQQV